MYQLNNTIFLFKHVSIKNLLQINYTIFLFNASVNDEFTDSNETA